MTGLVWRGVAIACVAVVLAGGIGGGVGGAVAGATDDNESPVADAGLDQEVVVNETVVLDASSSRDPDGSVEAYEWEVETPGGGVTAPACSGCEQTELQVHRAGTYNATVTVTDDDGASRSDTMHIHVSTVERPAVTVTGATSVVANETEAYTATLTAGDRPLVRVDWYVDGGLHARRSVEGEAATDTATLRLTEPGNHTVTAEVYDAMGRTNASEVSVVVVVPLGTRPCHGAIWNVSSGAWDTGVCGDTGTGGDDAGGGDSGAGAGGSGVGCSRYGGQDGSNTGTPSDDYYCENDRLIALGAGEYEIHDADTDGDLVWDGEQLDESELDRLDGIDGVEVNRVVDSIRFEDRDSYEEAFGTRALNPENDVTQSNQKKKRETGGDSSTGNDIDEDSNNNESTGEEGLPHRWKRRL